MRFWNGAGTLWRALRSSYSKGWFHMRVLSIREVCQLVGLSRSTIVRGIDAGTFPAPRRLSARRVGWPEAVIVEWLNAAPDARPAA